MTTDDSSGLVRITLTSSRVLHVSKGADGWWHAVDPEDPAFSVQASNPMVLREQAERLERLTQKLGAKK